MVYAGKEKDVFKLPEAMKHPKEQDDTSYAIDDMKLVPCDYVEELLMLNQLDEYLEGIYESKEDRVGEGTPEQAIRKTNDGVTLNEEGKWHGWDIV